MKKVCRYLFHVLAHIYWAHFKETVALELQGHLNTLYAHFIVFVREFNLIDPKETCIMDDLSEVLCAPLPPHPHNHVTERWADSRSDRTPQRKNKGGRWQKSGRPPWTGPSITFPSPSYCELIKRWGRGPVVCSPCTSTDWCECFLQDKQSVNIIIYIGSFYILICFFIIIFAHALLEVFMFCFLLGNGFSAQL